MRACGYLITVGLLVSGCSSLPDFGKWFEGDTDQQAKTLLAEAAKTAGENSEEPEKAAQQLAYEKATSNLADRMSNVLTAIIRIRVFLSQVRIPKTQVCA